MTPCRQVGKLLVEQGQVREALDYHRREQQVCESRGKEEYMEKSHLIPARG